MKNIEHSIFKEFITCEVQVNNGTWVVESIACANGLIIRTLATCVE